MDVISERNYYKLSAEYMDLHLKKKELLNKLRVADLNKQYIRSVNIQENHDTFAAKIVAASTALSENANNLNDIINKEDPFIQIPYKYQQPFQQLLHLNSTSFQTIKMKNFKDCLNLKTTLETSNIIKKQIQEIENSLEANYELMTKVENINDNHSLQLKDVHKPRERRSHLSESTFINPFQSINISTSSPKSIN